MSNVIDAVFKLTDDFSKPFSSCLDALTDAGKLGKQTRKQLDNIGKSTEKLGNKLTTGVTLPIVGLATAALKTGIDFEEAMSSVKAISGATGEDFEALREKAKELGADTKYSATEVADAMTEMAKAGFESQDIIDGMGGILGAAAASGESIGSVSTIVSDAITSFKMSADETGRVADVLTEAANAGTIDIADLGESFKYVGPLASSYSFNIEEASTALLAMSKAGIKGSQAGTSLKNILINLTKPTKAMKSVMDELNIDITDGNGNFKSLNDIIGTLQDSFDGLTEVERNTNAEILAGKEGAPGLLQLLSYTSDEYDDLTDSMESCTGIAEETASIMQDNVAAKWEQFTGSLETLSIELTENVLPYLSEFLDKVTGVVDAFGEMDKGTQEAALKWVAFAAAMGPVLSILGKGVQFGVGIADLLAKFSGVGAAGAGAAGAAGASGAAGGGVAAGLTGLGTALAPLLPVFAAAGLAVGVVATHLDEFKGTLAAVADNCSGSFTKISDAFGRLVNACQPMIQVFGAAFMAFGDLVAAAFDGLLNSAGFTLFVDGLASIIAGIIDILTGVITWLSSIFLGDWNGAWTAVYDVVFGVGELISGVIEGVLGIVGSLASGVKGVVDAVGSIGGKVAGAVTGKNASGTNNWRGGLTSVNEQGGEIMNLPNGTQIIPHDLSRNMIGNSGSTVTITGNTFTVREQADIDRITDALVRKMYRAQANMGTA